MLYITKELYEYSMNTSTIVQQRPFHLSYYEDDLCYVVREISLGRDYKEIRREGEPPEEEDYVFVMDEPNRMYIRIFYYKPTQEFRVAITVTSWPAFAEDPFRSGSSVLVGESSLRNALEGIHRVYFYYRHESARPVPYYDHYMLVTLTPQAIRHLQNEVGPLLLS